MINDEFLGKVEKILKGSQDFIPSPSSSVKIQIMDGKVCLSYEGNIFFCFQKFVDTAQQCFALLPQVNFPVGDGLNPGYLLKSFLP